MIAARLLAVAGGGSFTVPEPPPPSGGDEEFNAALSGDWTTVAVAGPDGNATTNPGHVCSDDDFAGKLHMRATNDTYVYAYRLLPSTPPITVTMEISAAALEIIEPADIALCVGNPSDGFVQIANPSCFSGSILNVETMTWGNLATFTNSFDEAPLAPGYGGPFPPIFLRLVIASASDVSAYWSWDNRLYADKWEHRNPTASPGNLSTFNPSHVLVAIHPGLGQTAEVLVEAIRFS